MNSFQINRLCVTLIRLNVNVTLSYAHAYTIKNSCNDNKVAQYVQHFSYIIGGQ